MQRLLVTALILLGVALSRAQEFPPAPPPPPTPAPPVRDAGAIAVRLGVGTGVIAGTVFTDEPNARPLRRVTLSLSSTGGPSVTRMTTSDDQGRFAFTRLPAGTYTAVRANKGGFVSTVYGQKRVNGLGIPIALADGQRVNITIRMLRGGVITGTVTDQTGKPATGVSVQAMAIRTMSGERQPAGPAMAGSGGTDDRGMYRIYNLAPGDYLVSASPRFLTGGEIRPVTADEVRWAQQQLQPGAGAPSGATAPGRPAPPPKPGQAVAYSPVYYPGTSDAAAAAPITVAAGQEMTNVDLRIGFVPTARIEGLVVEPDGQPAQNVQLSVVPKADAGLGLMPPMMLFETMVSNRPQVIGGKFTLPAMKPGEYVISARAAPRGDAPTPGAGRGGASPAMSLWALTDLSVGGVDQSGVVVRLEPGMMLSGRIAFEGTTLQPPPDLSRVSLRLSMAPNPTGMTVSINPATAQVSADGTFMFAGVTPGRYLLSGAAPAAAAVPGVNWQIKSAMADGVDAADLPLEMRPGQNVADTVLTFTDKSAEVSGMLTDGNGKPTSDFSVILFPVNKALWYQRSRRLKPPVRTGTDGRFRFTSVPAGDYYLAALTDFEQADLASPAFLDQVATSGAIKITVGEGEKTVQDLRLAGG